MPHRVGRRTFFGSVAAGTLLAGCIGGDDEAGSGEGTDPEGGTDAGEPTSKPITSPVDGGSPSVGTDASFVSTPDEGTPPTIDRSLPLVRAPSNLRDAAVSGGPPKDGIPSIDSPTFVDPAAADDFLDPGDVVFGVAGEGTAKAYPQRILVHHEIVNDEIAGFPASVTYCPLTGTPMGFWRGGTEFGVSGRLINSNLVMYDRAEDRWWPQVLATAIPGPWHEDPERQSLSEFRVVWTTWGLWRRRFPDGAVLSRDTGFVRNYDNDPYGSYNPKDGYYEYDDTMFPSLQTDDRYHQKRMVIGVRTPDGAACFLKDALGAEKLLTGELADETLLAVYDQGLDTAYVYRNPDGASFDYEDGAAVGPYGTAHPPDWVPLERVLAFDAMWFAWYGFYPETAVYE